MAQIESAAFGFMLPSGASLMPDGACGAGAVIIDWVMRGAGAMNSRQLIDALDGLGLHRGSGITSGNINLSCAMEASNLSIENLKRILDNLVDWTDEYAKDYDELEELYGNVVGQWRRYIGHVSAQVGGAYENLKTTDQEGVVYQPVPKWRQTGAVEWLDTQVFTTPEWLVRDDILRRIEAVGMLDRIRGAQASAVNNLLNVQRMARLLENEIVFGEDSYTLTELFADLRGSLFSELANAEAITGYRRTLQRVYVERLQYYMEQDPPVNPILAQFGYANLNVSQSDIRAYVRGELETLKSQADRAAGRTRDNMTRLHLRDLSARIADILDTVSD